LNYLYRTYWMKIWCAICWTLSFGCSEYEPDLGDLHSEIRLTRQMKKAIAHYQETGEEAKLQALVYLLNNMGGHFAFANILSQEYDSILSPQEYGGEIPANNQKHGIVLDRLVTLEEKYGSVKTSLTKVRMDADLMRADYLIENVEYAFKVWNNAPWAKGLSFSDFCEYVLPYRVGHEPVNSWRPSGYANFGWVMNQGNIERKRACSIINDSIKNVLSNMMEMKMYPIRLTYDNMYKIKVGVCEDETAFATMAMRSVGLPVGIDFVPQWPWRSMGHSWNYLLLENGETMPFMGTESNPGVPHFKLEKKGKVYRKTFAKNEKSLALMETDHDLLPQFFRSPYLKDVTELYAQVYPVNVKASGQQKYLYLSVFDNINWVPIDWAKIQGETASFDKLEGGVVYMPTFYENGKYLLPQQPFLLEEDGMIEILEPDFNRNQTLKLKRKYPLSEHMDAYLGKMRGGRFEVANKQDFSDAIVLSVLESKPEPYLRTIANESSQGKFKYVRYVASDSGRCNMAILNFYGFEGNRRVKLKGTIIGTEGSYKGYGAIKQMAFDNDPSTFFDAPEEEWGKAWIGLALDKPIQISHVDFMPRNDTNTIFEGQVYELFYWSQGWEGLGRETGDSTEEVIFDNVPSGALYLLHNHNGGTEERIFTYKDGTIHWY